MLCRRNAQSSATQPELPNRPLERSLLLPPTPQQARACSWSALRHSASPTRPLLPLPSGSSLTTSTTCATCGAGPGAGQGGGKRMRRRGEPAGGKAAARRGPARAHLQARKRGVAGLLHGRRLCQHELLVRGKQLVHIHQAGPAVSHVCAGAAGCGQAAVEPLLGGSRSAGVGAAPSLPARMRCFRVPAAPACQQAACTCFQPSPSAHRAPRTRRRRLPGMGYSEPEEGRKGAPGKKLAAFTGFPSLSGPTRPGLCVCMCAPRAACRLGATPRPRSSAAHTGCPLSCRPQ